jgi:primosomal replication protein N
VSDRGGVNRVTLTASIVEVKALRFTPAGLPALDLRLEHESTVEEAGHARVVKASVKAVAVGAVAERLVKVAIGEVQQFAGFLATPRGGKHVVLHIQEFQQD